MFVLDISLPPGKGIPTQPRLRPKVYLALILE
jgi:hypothetical protein